MLGKHLDSDRAVETRVAGSIDRAHASGAESRENLLRNSSDVCFEYCVRRQVFPPEERVGSPIGWLDASTWPRFFVDVLHLGWRRWFRHTPLGFSPWCRRSPRSCGRSRWSLRRAPVWSSSGGAGFPSG